MTAKCCNRKVWEQKLEKNNEYKFQLTVRIINCQNLPAFENIRDEQNIYAVNFQ